MQKAVATTPEDLFEIPPDATVSIDAVLATVARGQSATQLLIESGGYEPHFTIAHQAVIDMLSQVEACFVQIRKMAVRL